MRADHRVEQVEIDPALAAALDFRNDFAFAVAAPGTEDALFAEAAETGRASARRRSTPGARRQ